MNTLVEAADPKDAPLQLPKETASLIKASIAENTLKAYQCALQSLTNWLSGRTLSDTLLANYITSLHDCVCCLFGFQTILSSPVGTTHL